MFFNLFLKLVKVESEADRLKWSVYYGWGLATIIILSFCIFGVVSETSTTGAEEPFAMILGISVILFAFRYTSTKPFLGAIAGGVTVMSVAFIIDSIFSRRNNSATLGAFVGVMLTLLFILLKNIIVGIYYLIKETIRYVKFKKNSQSFVLEETDLSATSN